MCCIPVLCTLYLLIVSAHGLLCCPIHLQDMKQDLVLTCLLLLLLLLLLLCCLSCAA
jgi:hypothetical protein